MTNKLAQSTSPYLQQHADNPVHCPALVICFGAWRTTFKNPKRSDLVCFTLERTRKGGIFDQWGGGFARYSVDSDWTIPHFEKMLYDNGPLLKLLADAWLVSEDDRQKALFKRVAEQTAVRVMREMQSSGTEWPRLHCNDFPLRPTICAAPNPPKE